MRHEWIQDLKLMNGVKHSMFVHKPYNTHIQRDTENICLPFEVAYGSVERLKDSGIK